MYNVSIKKEGVFQPSPLLQKYYLQKSFITKKRKNLPSQVCSFS